MGASVCGSRDGGIVADRGRHRFHHGRRACGAGKTAARASPSSRALVQRPRRAPRAGPPRGGQRGGRGEVVRGDERGGTGSPGAPRPQGASASSTATSIPGNTLWARGRLTGVVDWSYGSWGPPAVDAAHLRWNLALAFGPEAADALLPLLDPPPAIPTGTRSTYSIWWAPQRSSLRPRSSAGWRFTSSRCFAGSSAAAAGARASPAPPPGDRPATAAAPRHRAGRSAARRSAGLRSTAVPGLRSPAGRSCSRRR
jgi:hypothetical protein